MNRNRYHNVGNPYQGTDKKVLCVCSAGLLRSPTCANVLHREFGYNTRAVGTNVEYALVPLDPIHLVWSDEVVVMDWEQYFSVIKYCDDEVYRKDLSIKVLHVPDIYAYMDDRLQDIIAEKYVATDYCYRKAGEREEDYLRRISNGLA